MAEEYQGKVARCPFCHAAHQWDGEPEPWEPAMQMHDRGVGQAERQRGVEKVKALLEPAVSEYGEPMSETYILGVTNAIAAIEEDMP